MWSVVGSLIVALAAISCNEEAFRTGAEAAKKKPAPKPAEPVKEQKFPLNQQSTRALDMVWVIDNSASMTEETAHVRQNFASFVASVQQIADLNLALISESTGARGVSLGQVLGGNKGRQVDSFVGSTNALAMLASSLCPENTTDAISGDQAFAPNLTVRLCGQNVSNSQTIEGLTEVSRIRGSLSQFLRPQAQKVFVVVTDDNAAVIDHSNTLSMLGQAQLTAGAAHFFGFIGQTSGVGSGDPNCEIANPGVAYTNLATQTQGETFSICEQNWDQHFQKLTKTIEQIVIQQFALNDPAELEIVEILVDGNPVALQEFRIEGKTITIINPEPYKNSKELTVRYKTKS